KGGPFHFLVYRFHHHDGIVDHDADRQHQGEHGQDVNRKPEQIEEEKSTDKRNGDGDCGYDRRPEILQENKHDDKYEKESFEYGVPDLGNGFIDLVAHAIGDFILNPFGEILREALEHLAYLNVDFARVRPAGL